MDWFIRFALGFPARQEDVIALRRALPEIERGELRTEGLRYLWLFQPEFETNDALIAQLRKWISKIEPAEESQQREIRTCSSNYCPLKSNKSSTTGDDGQLIARFMVAAGGPNAKPPRDSFFDLVRRTHPENDVPREVILTDPYIYSDVSEDGLEGGFSNLVGYLEALGLSIEDSFRLSTTPSPKRGTLTARNNLRRLLKKRFKRIEFSDFSPVLKFHDRFYIVRHRSGALRGVFGPSLNGLSSDAIVLMGDIDELQPLTKLSAWFA